MAKSLDKVLQPDGSWKWELVEPGLSERMGNDPGTVCSAPEPKKEECVSQSAARIQMMSHQISKPCETFPSFPKFSCQSPRPR